MPNVKVMNRSKIYTFISKPKIVTFFP